MSFYKPPAGASGTVAAFFHDSATNTTPSQTADACPIIPGSPGSGLVDCVIPSNFSTFLEVDFATVQADAIAAQLAFDGGTTAYIAYGVFITVTGPGYATYGCRRPDHPEDMDTITGCAAFDTRHGISIQSRLEVTGDWYPMIASVQNVTGWPDGTTGPYPYQEDAGYELTFGLGTGGVGNEVFVLNPTPINPSPDVYGNEFWSVVFPAATVPPSFTIDSTALGAHGTTIDAYVTAYSFLDDGDVTPPPPSDTWMCVL